MPRSVPMAVPMLLSAQPWARGVETCPELPADSGIEWAYREGPDFDLCYAIESSTKKDSFGIYLGRHPSFQPRDAKPIGGGKIAGREVTWYPRDADEHHPQSGRQTIVELKPGELAHLWTGAGNDRELQSRLQILQGMKFKDRGGRTTRPGNMQILDQGFSYTYTVAGGTLRSTNSPLRTFKPSSATTRSDAGARGP